MNEQDNRQECAEQAWIDQYLLGELEQEELSRFEFRLENDPVFREKVSLHKDIIAGIFLFEAEHPTVSNPSLFTPNSNVRQLMNAAFKMTAVIAILGASFFLLQNSETTSPNITAEVIPAGIEYPIEWGFGDVDFGEMAALNDISLNLEGEKAMLFRHFFEFHNAIPN